MEAEVIVAGAGGAGLMVAAELALAGVRPVVLDALPARNQQSRAGGLQPRSVELLEMRGYLPGLVERALDREPVGGHFAGLPVPLDCTPWATRHPHPMAIPQDRVEALLEAELERRGVRVARQHVVEQVGQDADGVTVSVRAPEGQRTLRARYLVASDGAHSTVRRLLGVPFPGLDGTMRAVSADVVLSGLPADVPTRSGHISQHVRTGGGYWALVTPLGQGLHRAVFGGPPQAELPRQAPVTTEEVSAMVSAVFGPGAALRELRFGSRFTDATRQVERYRVGRVLLAGDAAHIHAPVGGQGLNLGLQDAVNLGWKLAATVRGWAPPGLLDTYHAERHPVAARVLEVTRAQRVVMGPGSGDAAALRAILTELVRLPDTNRYLAGMMSGLDIRYPLPGAVSHPLVGARMPDVELATADGPVRYSEVARSGLGVLVDLTGGPAPVAAGWSDRVTHLAARQVRGSDGAAAPALPEDVAGVLVRPDGYVCWAAAGSDDTGLSAALTRWFGAAMS